MNIFHPIIHNLIPGDKGYIEAQYYNYLIESKSKYMEVAQVLQDKIRMEQEWIKDCKKALQTVKTILNEVQS